MDHGYVIKRIRPKTFLITVDWSQHNWNSSYSEKCFALRSFTGRIRKWCYDNGFKCVIKPLNRTKSIGPKSAYTISVRKEADILAFMLKWC